MVPTATLTTFWRGDSKV